MVIGNLNSKYGILVLLLISWLSQSQLKTRSWFWLLEVSDFSSIWWVKILKIFVGTRLWYSSHLNRLVLWSLGTVVTGTVTQEKVRKTVCNVRKNSRALFEHLNRSWSWWGGWSSCWPPAFSQAWQRREGGSLLCHKWQPAKSPFPHSFWVKTSMLFSGQSPCQWGPDEHNW